MNVVLIEPSFPANQRDFARALHAIGATVIGIGERSKDSLDEDMRRWLTHYEQVSSVVREDEVERAVRFVQGKVWVDRLEATVEAHVECAARVRERCGIPGTSVRTAWLCRDKPAMKATLREGGIPCAQSTGASTPEEAREFARRVGFPLILKPRDSAGASGTSRVDDEAQLEQALSGVAFDRGASIAIEEFVSGHEGFWDTLTIRGHVAHEFVTHYYPNVLEAMRTRWISPQFIATNRIDTAPGYAEVRELGRRVLPLLGIETSATHMEWFAGEGGLKFSEIGCRPPGVRAWDLYCAANEMDLYVEWALAVTSGRTSQRASRKYSAGIIALRPDRDGHITGYQGVEAIRSRYEPYILDSHLPPVGTPTQPVEAGYMANAWLRMRHPDYDELRRMLDDVGRTLKVYAA